jgi:hypothetical protein
MTNRDRLIQFLAALLAAALAAVGARYGIPIPPPAPPPATTAPEVGPAPMPLPQPPSPDTPRAIARIQFGNAGCTATVIGPRLGDGRYWVLTASHCVQSIGQHGTMRMLDGRTLGIVVQALDRKPDCCWCLTESNAEVLPFALLADRSPAPGTRIWHAGYGVDKPGNREDGSVDAAPDSNGQLRMTLSVSSGDSGGGICIDQDNRVISCVCCTAARGQRSSVWGASVESIRRTQPAGVVADIWTPIEIPTREK